MLQFYSLISDGLGGVNMQSYCSPDPITKTTNPELSWISYNKQIYSFLFEFVSLKLGVGSIWHLNGIFQAKCIAIERVKYKDWDSWNYFLGHSITTLKRRGG